LFWHGLWLDCNRPKTGAVADCIRRTRAAYHYAVRQLKKDEDSIVRERVAEAILSDGGRNFWSDIKRVSSNKSSNSRIVDGETDVGAIAKLFATKYRELQSSVPYDKDDMQRIVDCFTHIALLLTSITVHGTAPNSFHVSTIVPIPKGRNKNLSDSSNFRGIASSPVYGNMITLFCHSPLIH
jgi:hypothetical protein